MKTFLATDRNDLLLNSAGNLQVFNSIEAIAQTARQYMQARRGEMFLAVPDGLPFDPVAWSGEPNIAQFEAAGRARLLQVPDVVEVLAFDAQLINNELSYIATIRTTAGEVAISG
jgi:hypothetical protein